MSEPEATPAAPTPNPTPVPSTGMTTQPAQSQPQESQIPVPDRTVFMPPIDIYDSDEGLVLLADLPGVTIESLEIQVQDNRLTLFGSVKPALPTEARLLHQEFEWGDFLRSFILSDEVDHDRITAKLNNGVLEVVLPRAAKTEPRRIQVNKE
ncbi:MAG: Hsp20/alpha crystallin family protein [Planctomycetota bacterium]